MEAEPEPNERHFILPLVTELALKNTVIGPDPFIQGLEFIKFQLGENETA